MGAAFSSTPPAAVEIRCLTKEFPLNSAGARVRAVEDLSLEVPSGSVFGLLGPNGSGKSTTIKILLGLLAPTRGECLVFGLPGDRAEARREVGYLPEAPDYPGFLTGREMLRLYARLSGVPKDGVADRVAGVLARVGLEGAADRRIRSYSKGMLQRIGLAQAFVHDPRLLVLDEPMAGVDPRGAAAIGRMIEEWKREGKTIVLSSHLLAQVGDLCDRVAILDRGRLVAEGRVADLCGSGGRMALVVDRLPEADVAGLREWLAARGHRLESVGPPRTRLDELFLETTGEDRRRRPVAAGPDARDGERVVPGGERESP